jgi:hypothetical protein
LTLEGHLGAEEVAGELAQRVGDGLVVIDLDSAEFLEDDIAPVIRRFAAASGHVKLRATKPGARRWLLRNRLEDLA